MYLYYNSRASFTLRTVLVFEKKFDSLHILKITFRYVPGNFTLWGGSVRSLKTFGLGHYSDVEACWFGMSLSGPSFASWSIILDVNLPLPEAQNKLEVFKNSFTLKKKTTAYALVSSHKNDPDEINMLKTIAFRQVFPTINLTCIYNTAELPLFGINGK